MHTSPIVVSNAYYNNGWFYDGTGAASLINFVNGEFVFSTAPSGTGGTGATFTERMRITNSGNVGIGTTSPSFKIHIRGHESGNADIRIDQTMANQISRLILNADREWRIVSAGDTVGDPLLFHDGTAGATRMVINDAGNVGIGTVNPTRRLFVNGDAGGTTDWFNDSDERLKKNVKTIENALFKVSRLRGVNFEWRETENHPSGLQLGLIAQEVKEVVPEVISKPSGSEYYAISYGSLVPLLIEAIKEQQKEIEFLKAKLNIENNK